MPAKLVKPTTLSFLSRVGVGLGLVWSYAAPAHAAPGASTKVVQNPYVDPEPEPVVIDFSADAAPEHRPRIDRDPPALIRFSELDAYQRYVPASEPDPTADAAGDALPDGWAQVGGMVVPEAMLDGADMVPDAARYLTAVPDPQGGQPTIDEICAFPDETPAGIYDYDYRPGGEFPRFHTVYLNFVGATLMTGGENSAENMSNIARSGHPFPVYAGGEDRAIAAAQAVAADFEDWAVRVVYLERPPKVLPYTMVMVGGSYSDTTAGPSGGVAPLDCEDHGQRNVCYAFQNLAPATSQANVISQEIGHTLGLGHISAPDSVMAAGYAPTQGGDLGFHDGCYDTIQVSGQSAACVGVNKCHCGVGEAQNDKKTLGTTFSPAGPDMVEPEITLLQPQDGQVFEVGETIRVEFEPWDDVGGYGWKLMIENEAGELLVDQVDYERGLLFDLVEVPEGTYTFTGLIQDHADHIVTHSITVIVGSGDAAGTGGDSGSGGSDDGMATGDGTATGGTAGDDAGVDVDATDDGCGCRVADDGRSDERPWAMGMLALLGLLTTRRRRR